MTAFQLAVAASLLAVIGPASALSQKTDTVVASGRRFEVLRMGAGIPTLVLESGAGEGASEWRGIIADLAKLTHVVAYSRAGHGASEATTNPGSPQASVQDLHDLLITLGETQPVILAGHSWGGLLTRLYLSTYPGAVAGLVLIDATHESQYARWQPLSPRFRIVDSVRILIPRLPPAARDDFAQILAVEETQRVSGMRPLPAQLPLAVITAMKPCAPTREFTCRDPKARAVWRDLQDEWFEEAQTGIHIVSAQTEHYVMNDQPQLILSAVQFILTQTRATKP